MTRLENAEQQSRSNRHAVLVVNTRSNQGARWYSEAKRRLIEGGLTLDASYPVRNAEKLPEIVQQAIAGGHRFIVVGGGDGTISSVVGHFAYNQAVLGILPFGTANCYARSLRIPLTLRGAIDVLVNGSIAEVDLGKVNGFYFANGVSIGLPAAVGRATPPILKSLFGRAAYMFVAANRFFRHKHFSCTLTTDNGNTCFDALDVWIAKGACEGGFMRAPEDQLDNGELTVFVIKGNSRWKLLEAWMRVGLRLPLGEGEQEIRAAYRFILDAFPKQDVAIDGEVVTHTPVCLAVAHKALLLKAPVIALS